MTDRELERKLANALDHTAPNDLEEVLSRCEARKGTVIPMKKTTNHTWKSLIAACLTLVLLLGGGGGWFYQQSHAVASVVSLDVNPSIEMNVNRKGEVIACTALNEEAADVLTDYTNGEDMKGVKLKVAVNAIVTSMLSRGYLTDLSSAILISVEDKDQARAARLQQELTASVDVTLQEASSQAAIFSQTMDELPELETQARANQVSIGKAYLVRQVMEMNGTIAMNSDTVLNQLCALSVEELKDLLEGGHKEIPVGRDAAAVAAETYAGTLEVSSVTCQVDAELDDRTPHYEVDLYYNGREYEYRVDAFTGGILSGPKDILSTKANEGSASYVTPVTPGTPATEPVQLGRPTAPTANQNQIDETSAFNIAAADFTARYPELSGMNLFDNRAEMDFDDGRFHYDVEFWVDGYEVDYEIDVETGAILSWDTEYEGPKPQTKPDPKPEPQPQQPAANGDIGQAAAKAAALKHAGLTESQVSRLQAERDMDDGRLEYEVDFKSGGMEYEYTIDGTTGAILEHEVDRDD